MLEKRGQLYPCYYIVNLHFSRVIYPVKQKDGNVKLEWFGPNLTHLVSSSVVQTTLIAALVLILMNDGHMNLSSYCKAVIRPEILASDASG